MNPGKRLIFLTCAVIFCSLLAACTAPVSYDVILRNGMIYDGSGGQPYIGDVAFDGDVMSHWATLARQQRRLRSMFRAWWWRPDL